MMLLSTVSN